MINSSQPFLNDEKLCDDLARLIALDTCFPPAASYGAFCDLVEDLAAEFDPSCERIDVPEPLWRSPEVHGARTNLVMRPNIGPADAPEAMIYFHSDTAPVGDGWTRPPLTLTREGARLFGRGTADMKGCIAAVLAALRALKAQGTELAFRPVLAFCTDEEGGLYPGIRYLAETQDLPEVLLNLNGGAVPRNWGGCLGSMDIAISGIGRASHSGRPDQGINALQEMLPVMAALVALKPQIEARITSMSPPPGAPPLCARLNITACNAGDKGSAIPGLCRVIINRRYLPEETSDDVFAEIRTAAEMALRDTLLPDWSIQLAGHLPPVSDPTGPWTTRWAAARARATHRPLSDYTTYGSGTSSDFGWVQKAGITHMLLGGLMRSEANVHGPDEFTTITDLAELAHAVALFLSADFSSNPTDLGQQGTIQSNPETSK